MAVGIVIIGHDLHAGLLEGPAYSGCPGKVIRNALCPGHAHPETNDVVNQPALGSDVLNHGCFPSGWYRVFPSRGEPIAQCLRGGRCKIREG